MAVSGVVCPQGGQPAAVFYPFGHPMPYAHDTRISVDVVTKQSNAVILYNGPMQEDGVSQVRSQLLV
jgi:hypothetical protein